MADVLQKQWRRFYVDQRSAVQGEADIVDQWSMEAPISRRPSQYSTPLQFNPTVLNSTPVTLQLFCSITDFGCTDTPEQKAGDPLLGTKMMHRTTTGFGVRMGTAVVHQSDTPGSGGTLQTMGLVPLPDAPVAPGRRTMYQAIGVECVSPVSVVPDSARTGPLGRGRG